MIGAQDATQEAFIPAWRALSNFSERSRFGTWLHRIAAERGFAASDRAACGIWRVSGEDSSTVQPRCLRMRRQRLMSKGRLSPHFPGAVRNTFSRWSALCGDSHEERAEFLGIAVGTSKAQLNGLAAC
jgi:RNA polymerase sigma-70 factor (ECF subfamily)